MTAEEDPGLSMFRAFEHAGWERIPAEYDNAFAGLTPQAIPALLEAAGIGKETRVLDVASGPGYVAAAAAACGAHVIGTDFSAAMVERAQRRFPALDFREADAEALPFEDQTFDAVLMNFGLLHLANPETAAREAWRVLRRGGRFAFTVWAQPEDAVGFGAVLRAIAAHGSLDVPLPAGPPFFRFSDPSECERLLIDAGFVGPRVTSVPQTWILEAADNLFDNLIAGTVRTAGLLRAQDPERLAAIRAAVLNEVKRNQTDGVYALSMPAVMAVAERR